MRNLLLIMMIALFSVSVSFGQGRVVTGTVTEADTGDPIPGANVVVKGTSSGSVTDIDGKYSVNIPDDGAVLAFSFVGFVTEEIEVGNQSVINIALVSDVTALSEIVVTGYGTQEKKEITSAVASVKSEDFNVGNVQNPAQLIQGKVAGLTITRAGGNPNGGYEIRLRGLSTLGPNTQPLIVIDGVIGASLDNVDPNDIESMDVLKDGSAAAIYGTRGASGVILVTTKGGKEGRMNVDYNGNFIAESAYRFQPVLDASQWRQLSSEIGLGQDYGASTNWFEEITRTGISQVHNVAVSGGSSSTTYRMSLNYRDVQGIAKKTGNQTISTRLNLTHKALNDRLTLTMNVAGSWRDADYGQDDAFKFATIYNPTAPVRADDNTQFPGSIDFTPGNFDQYGGFFEIVQFDYKNPVAILEQNINDGTDKRINISGRAAYELIDNLIFDVAYSIQSESFLRGTYNSKESFWGGMDRNGNAERKLDDTFNQLFETTIRWNGDLSNGNIDAVGGYSYQEFVNQGFNARGGDFITDQFTYNNLSAAEEFAAGLGTVDSYKNSNKILAFFGRVNFNWNDTYFLSASGRYEGSSRFGENEKWGFFPGISGGVELANYINSSAVTNLKLRASYGITGNNLPESLLSILRYGPGSNFFYNGAYVPSYGPVSNENPNLRWEKKAEFNIGVDYALFNDKLFGSVEYYSRETSDLLQQFTVPVPPNLYNRTWTNVGTLKNTGLELLLNWNAVDNGNFSYTPTITFTNYLKNDIVSLSDSTSGFEYGVRDIANMGSPGQNNTPTIRVQEGWPIGQMWGLVYEGISPTGDWVHKDLNDDGQIDNLDRTVIGNGLPKVELGWGNNFTFGNWDANVFVRGVFGHDLINQMTGFYAVPNVIVTYNPNEKALDMKNENGTYLNTSDGKFSSLHVENASYLKLDNMSIGYNFNMAGSEAFRKIRVYATANNVFVITKYTGSDPEVRYTDNAEDNANLNNPLAPGIDRRNTWFMARSFSLGISLGF
jgi:iron complex outermembrane receptor protein